MSNAESLINHGLTGGLKTNLATAMTIAAFTGLAWANSVELNIRIFATFKRRNGLYFWSLVVASWGVIIYSFAFLVKFFEVVTNMWLCVTLITIGWYGMVSGQSLVLYSRLHLIVRDGRRIRWVLWMIIVNAVLFHIPTTVATFGANSHNPGPYTKYYQIMEKIQVTAFCIQEFVISGLYINETRKILMPSEQFQRRRVRRVMKHLIWINVFIILMDVTLLATEYANLYEIQITFKGALYAVKLRFEFTVLNQLMEIVKGHHSSHDNGPYSGSGGAVLGGAGGGAGGGDVRLETMTGRPPPDGTLHTKSKTYSVFAGKSSRPKKGTVASVMDDGVVLKTTEVTVKTSDSRADYHGRRGIGAERGASGSRDSSMSRASNDKRQTTRSPTDSEIEFAIAGA